VMRVRLRGKHGDEAAFYAERYPSGYDHTRWPDHVERVDETVRWAREILASSRIDSVADLSCGDGDLPVRAYDALGATGRLVLGDLNLEGVDRMIRRHNTEGLDVVFYQGSVSAAFNIPTPPVDLYVCSETLEHLDDPDGFLTALRPLTRHLLVTTPEGETGTGNPEHYWGWDSEAVGAMLAAAGFLDVVGHQVFTPLYDLHGAYRYQMWMVK